MKIKYFALVLAFLWMLPACHKEGQPIPGGERLEGYWSGSLVKRVWRFANDTTLTQSQNTIGVTLNADGTGTLVLTGVPNSRELCWMTDTAQHLVYVTEKTLTQSGLWTVDGYRFRQLTDTPTEQVWESWERSGPDTAVVQRIQQVWTLMRQ